MDAVTRAADGATSADDALVRRARNGDVAAFEVLVDTRIDRCYRLAFSILSNDADAADATQDALVSAWRQLPRLRDTAAFDGWNHRSSQINTDRVRGKPAPRVRSPVFIRVYLWFHVSR